MNSHRASAILNANHHDWHIPKQYTSHRDYETIHQTTVFGGKIANKNRAYGIPMVKGLFSGPGNRFKTCVHSREDISFTGRL